MPVFPSLSAADLMPQPTSPENRTYLGAPMTTTFPSCPLCSVDGRAASFVSTRRGIETNVGPLFIHRRRVRTGTVLRLAPLTEFARRRNQTPRESRRVRQTADTSGHLHEDRGPLATRNELAHAGRGLHDLSAVSGQGLYDNVNTHLHSDTVVSPRPVGRGTTRRHRNRDNYPDKLSGYIEERLARDGNGRVHRVENR